MSIMTLNGILVVVNDFHVGTPLTLSNSFEFELSFGANIAWLEGSDTVSVASSVAGSELHLRLKSEMEIVPCVTTIIYQT